MVAAESGVRLHRMTSSATLYRVVLFELHTPAADGMDQCRPITVGPALPRADAFATLLNLLDVSPGAIGGDLLPEPAG